MSVQILENGSWKRVADLPGQHNVNVVDSDDYEVKDDDGYDSILVITGASDRTITLPTAADNIFRVLKIIKVDAGEHKVIVDGEGSETVNGMASVNLLYQYNSVEIISNGSCWVGTAEAEHFYIDNSGKGIFKGDLLVEGKLDIGSQIVSASGTSSVTVNCPAGKFLTGGGANGGDREIRSCYPPNSSSWYAVSPYSVTAYALCARVQY